MKFLGFLFIFFFIFPWVFRWLLKAFVVSQVNKAQSQFQQQRNYQKPKAEGKITVDYTPPTPNNSDFKGGEYIDYEEVK